MKLNNVLLQRGTAIFSALLIVAIASTIATSLVVRQRIDIKRTQQMLSSEQAYRHAQGAIYWAKGIVQNIKLKSDEEDQDNAQTQQQFPLQLPSTILSSRRGVVAAQLDNLKDLFNINSLRNEDGVGKFVELLKKISPNYSDEQALQLAQTIQAWITEPDEIDDIDFDEDDNEDNDADGTKWPRSQTNTISLTDFDQPYLKLTPPYRPSHKPMTSISELRLIANISQPLYQLLSPYLIALPSEGKASNDKDNDDEDNDRESNNNSQNANSNNNLNNNANANADQNTNPNEGFYLLKTSVVFDDQQLTMYTLLQQAQENRKTTGKILWQSFGTR